MEMSAGTYGDYMWLATLDQGTEVAHGVADGTIVRWIAIADSFDF